MIIMGERLRRSFSSAHECSTGAVDGGGNARGRPITDEPWDCYHLESLLPLKETYRENREFGFLLRHYWIPATVLTFRQSSRMTLPDGRVDWLELEIERKMARCRSNECLWREKVRPVAAATLADVAIKAITGPSSFTLGYRPQAGLDLRVLGVCAAYDQQITHTKYPEPPTWYTITHGRVTSSEPIEDDRLALLIRSEKEITQSQYHRQEMPGGECVIVPHNGNRHYYELVRSTAKRRERCQVNIPCANLGAKLTFYYPKNTSFAQGTKWISPKTADWDGDLWDTSPNKTEVGHIAAAVYFWHTLRFDVFCVNPPLHADDNRAARAKHLL